MPIRQTIPLSVTLDATGAGSVSYTARGDLRVEHTRVVVAGGTGTKSSTASLELNGQEFEGSATGDNDQSDTAHLMLAGDIITCTWAGGRPGATATCTLRGIEYPAGQGMKAVS